MLMSLLCVSCIGTKVARPLKSVDLATEWLGTGGCETYYLKLTTNGTGTLVYMLPDATSGAVSTIKEWKLSGRTIIITSNGLTYPDETVNITGVADYSAIKIAIDGKHTACSWHDSVTLWRVDRLLHGISLGREGARDK